MTTESELIALVGRVESYEPRYNHDLERYRRRELNERIAAAVGIKATVKVGHEVLGNERWVPARLPDYLTSLDAAMTLVPDRYRKDISLSVSPMSIDMGGKDFKAFLGGHKNRGSGRTFALALTAAALRARATAQVSA